MYVERAFCGIALSHVYRYADSLLIDTGSSNTWVGAGKAFVKTSTSVQTTDRVVRITFFVTTACGIVSSINIVS